MSSFKFPSERSGSYNPKYYEDSGASSDVTQAELDTKANRSNDTLINPTLQNANFIGSVSGVLSSSATKLAILDANKTVGSEYTASDQDFPAFNPDVLAYYDFSSRTQPGRDFSGNGRHAKVLGGSLITLDDTTRTDILQLTPEYRNGVHPSLIHAFPAGMELDSFASIVQRSTFSTSFWIRWKPWADASMPMMVWSISRPEIGATELPGYTPSNMAWCWVRGGSMVFTTFVGGAQTFQAGFPLTQNVWTHVAITSTPGTNQTKFYKNGVLVPTTGTVDMTSIGPATSFTIGCARASDQLPNSANTRQYCNNLQGDLSDLMITSSVLSEAEIAKLYADDYGVSIFPIAGQSNATGQTAPVADDYDYSLIAGKVYAYSIGGKNVLPAVNPLPNSGSQAGLWLQFCRDFVQNTNFPRKRKVMVIQCAVGGSAMAAWVPGQTLYNRTVLAMTEAVELNFLNKINGFLWNQGEAEMSAFNLEYKAQLLSMIAGFVSVVPTFSTATPKVMCEISSASYSRFVSTATIPPTHMLSFMMSEMMSIVATDQTWAYVRSNDLSFTKEANYSVHYDSPSLRILGGRYYDSLLNILGIPNCKPKSGRVWQAIKSLRTEKAPLDSPNFTGNVTGITKEMLQLGNVNNTADTEKPVSALTQTELGKKINSSNGVASGFLGFINAAGKTLVAFGHASIFGSIASNVSNGYGELAFLNHSGFTNPAWQAFTWYKYTSTSVKSVLASLSYGGEFNVPGTITGPTIDAINTTASQKAPIAGPTFTGNVNLSTADASLTAPNLLTTIAGVAGQNVGTAIQAATNSFFLTNASVSLTTAHISAVNAVVLCSLAGADVSLSLPSPNTFPSGTIISIRCTSGALCKIGCSVAGKMISMTGTSNGGLPFIVNQGGVAGNHGFTQVICTGSLYYLTTI